jgi:ribonuclease Z
MIRVTFLGTSASRPTVGRNVSSIALQREGELFLLDCGEGTQRQMMRFGTGFALHHIFITHLHADHYLGVIGLLRTLALQGRTDPLRILAPVRSRPTLEAALRLGGERLPFPVEIRELEPGQAHEGRGYRIEAFRVRHGTNALGYALRETPRPGRFDLEAARSLGIPEGPLFGRLQRGESVEVDGRTILANEVVGPSRSGRLVVYTGDTRPCDEVIEASRGADLLVHDATFSEEESDRAHETFHSTARGAAEVAVAAGVKRLCLTHLSARYSANAAPLEREARERFPQARVAYDGLTVEVGFEADGVDAATGVGQEGGAE